MRARFDIDRGKIRRAQQQAAERTASRAAVVAQLRVKEGIVLTDRVGTGKMLNRIEIKQIGPAQFQVRSNEFYAHWQERGRGPVRPVKAKALRFKPKGGNAFVFAQYVKPDPGGHFFQRALSSMSARDFTG